MVVRSAIRLTSNQKPIVMEANEKGSYTLYDLEDGTLHVVVKDRATERVRQEELSPLDRAKMESLMECWEKILRTPPTQPATPDSFLQPPPPRPQRLRWWGNG